MDEIVRNRVEGLQQIILSQHPETKFRMEPGEPENLWNLCIYTPEGNLQMPPEIMQELDAIWRENKVTVLAIVYPLSMYDDE